MLVYNEILGIKTQVSIFWCECASVGKVHEQKTRSNKEVLKKPKIN